MEGCHFHSHRRYSRMLPYGCFSREQDSKGNLWSKLSTAALSTRAFMSAAAAHKKVTFSIQEEESACSPDCLYSIFNFIDQATPPPRFKTFKDGFLHVSNVIQGHGQFLQGMLLKNDIIDSGFPFVNYAVYFVQKNETFTHDPNMVKVIKEGYGDKQIHLQSGYYELESLWLGGQRDVGVRNRHRLPFSDSTVFVLVCFRINGCPKYLESTWRVWSGCNFLLGNLHSSIRDNLRRITFYKRIVNKGPAFPYLLLAEFSQVSAIYRIRDFVIQMNLRYSGLASLYVIDHQYLSSSRQLFED